MDSPTAPSTTSKKNVFSRLMGSLTGGGSSHRRSSRSKNDNKTTGAGGGSEGGMDSSSAHQGQRSSDGMDGSSSHLRAMGDRSSRGGSGGPKRKSKTPRHRATNAVLMSVTAKGNDTPGRSSMSAIRRRSSVRSTGSSATAAAVWDNIHSYHQDYSDSIGMDTSSNDYVNMTGSHSYTPWKPIWQ